MNGVLDALKKNWNMHWLRLVGLYTRRWCTLTNVMAAIQWIIDIMSRF